MIAEAYGLMRKVRLGEDCTYEFVIFIVFNVILMRLKHDYAIRSF